MTSRIGLPIIREHIEQLRVAPDDKPGAIRERLPSVRPKKASRLRQFSADVDHIIVPGMVHWGHPMFLGYFGWTTHRAGNSGRNYHCAAKRERDDVAHVSRRDRA